MPRRTFKQRATDGLLEAVVRSIPDSGFPTKKLSALMRMTHDTTGGVSPDIEEWLRGKRRVCPVLRALLGCLLMTCLAVAQSPCTCPQELVLTEPGDYLIVGIVEWPHRVLPDYERWMAHDDVVVTIPDNRHLWKWETRTITAWIEAQGHPLQIQWRVCPPGWPPCHGRWCDCDEARIFDDGFESGNTALWARSTPGGVPVPPSTPDEPEPPPRDPGGVPGTEG